MTTTPESCPFLCLVWPPSVFEPPRWQSGCPTCKKSIRPYDVHTHIAWVVTMQSTNDAWLCDGRQVTSPEEWVEAEEETWENYSIAAFFRFIHGLIKLFRPPRNNNNHLSWIVSTVLPIAALSALMDSLGVSFSGSDLKQQETNFSATELMFNIAFFSICHSSRITCVEEEKWNHRSGEIIHFF